MRARNDQFFKLLGDAAPRGLLDLIGLLPMDAKADVEPIDRTGIVVNWYGHGAVGRTRLELRSTVQPLLER